MNLLIWILALALAGGQIIRIPFAGGGIILLDMVAIIFCFFCIIKNKFKLFKPPLFLKIAFLFVLICILSLMLTPLTLNQAEMISSLSYTVRLSIYFSLGYLLFSDSFLSLRKKIIPALLFAGISLAVLGLLQFILLPNLQPLTIYGWDPHYFRTVSTFLDPNFLGAYLVLTSILLFAHLAHPKGVLNRHLVIAGIVLVYLALLTTFSRSSYLMFLVSGVTLSVLVKSKKIFLSVICLFLALMLGFYFYTQVVAEPRNIDREKSASFRLNTWEQGWTIFQKSPILGVGFNAYRYAIREFNLADQQFLNSRGSSSNDASLLYIAATTGVIGITIYLLFILNLLKYSYPLNPMLISAIAGLLIHSIFANSLFYPPILAWILLTAAVPKK